MLRPTALPWEQPRRELLLLVLVALAALSPVYVVSTQDVSRLCLSRALAAGHLTIGDCAGRSFDRAEYGGRIYSDKAPGMSALALPAVALTDLPSREEWSFESDPQLWAVRLLSGGIAFLLLTFAVGRVSEGIARGVGGPVLVTFGLGTIVAPLAATTFSHVTAAALGFGAFLLAWRRRPVLAGVAAGAAVGVEYTAGLIFVVVAAYVACTGGSALARYALGATPPLLLLGAYHWAAFGSPLHLPYHYVANELAAEQASGFFGIGAPRSQAVHDVLIGPHGLLVASPVLLAAGAGLVLLARRHPLEATACAVVTVLYLLLNVGYFLPYGGISPGPRFFVPALPFLAVGLACAFSRWRWPAAALAAASIVPTAVTMVTWSRMAGEYRYAWRQLTTLPFYPDRLEFLSQIDWNVLNWAGPSRNLTTALIIALGLAALAIALANRSAPARR